MKLLAIETATEACSVALFIDGEVRERFEIAPRRHTELVLPWADALLADAGIGKSQLDAIAVGRGPGAFTGVRLAVALAQGMALALDKPVLPISTLAALALSGMRPENISLTVLAAIDARMGEIYFGIFQADAALLVRPLSPEWIATSADPKLPQTSACLGVGSGFAASDQALAITLGEQLVQFDASALPHAADIARLAALAYTRGEAIDPEQVEPAYLRNKVALTLAEQQAARKYT